MALGKVPKDYTIRPIDLSTNNAARETAKGEMAGNRSVTVISILMDLPNQGLINTIRALYSLFASTPNPTPEDDYVITVAHGDISAQRVSRAVEATFKPELPSITKIYRVIDDMEMQHIISKQQAEHLNNIFANDRQEYPLAEIKTKIDHITGASEGGLAWPKDQLVNLERYWRGNSNL